MVCVPEKKQNDTQEDETIATLDKDPIVSRLSVPTASHFGNSRSAPCRLSTPLTRSSVTGKHLLRSSRRRLRCIQWMKYQFGSQMVIGMGGIFSWIPTTPSR